MSADERQDVLEQRAQVAARFTVADEIGELAAGEFHLGQGIFSQIGAGDESMAAIGNILNRMTRLARTRRIAPLVVMLALTIRGSAQTNVRPPGS